MEEVEFVDYPRKWDPYRDKVNQEIYDTHHAYMRNPTHERFMALFQSWEDYLELNPQERHK